jgi:large subunit ribosomal protein L19
MTMGIKLSPVDIDKRKNLELRPGSTVRVWQKIQERGKTRLQAYEGMVIAKKHGGQMGGTFTVRKVASGVGMEKIFPLFSPNIDKIEMIKQAKVRRAKLYYVRDKAARELRRRMKTLSGFVFTPEEEAAIAEAPAAPEVAAAPAEETAEVNEAAS